jgi:hypothetical protein
MQGPEAVVERAVGDARFPVSADVEAIGVRELAGMLAAV